MVKIEQRRGLGVLHLGSHVHGAMPIEQGNRYNLIMWMRSSDIRNKRCPMCNLVPTLRETEGDGDGFTQSEIGYCSII